MKATVRVVGMKAGRREHAVAGVCEHDPVLLIPEPDNPYDSDAVRVMVAPARLLRRRDELISSVEDPDGLGWVHPSDRRLFRQVGYLPAAVAATLALPAAGVVGWVSRTRDAPDEYDAAGRALPTRTAGCDVTANLTRRDERTPA